MSQRLLGFDPATGLAQWWLEDGEGNWLSFWRRLG